MNGIGLERQVACVKRELYFRRKVYPRRVDRGLMTQHDADREIVTMEAVLRTLQDLERRLNPELPL